MGLEVVSRRPARMSIANVATGESIEAQLNPSELEEALEVAYNRLTIPGLSHQPLQFTNTGNLKLTFELMFEALEPAADLPRLLLARRFLQSLCYPPRGAQDVRSGGPPRALFIWPNLASLTCVITGLTFKHQRFNLEGTPVQFSAKVTLEEIRDVRLTSEDVYLDGTERSGASGGEA